MKTFKAAHKCRFLFPHVTHFSGNIFILGILRTVSTLLITSNRLAMNSKQFGNFLKFVLIFLCGLFYITPTIAMAQSKLQDSPRGSTEIFVYKPSHEDLRKIYIDEKEIDESMLHTFVTSYPVGSATPKLPRGNYITVRADRNTLIFADLTIDNFCYYVMNNEDEAIVYLTDTLDNIISFLETKIGYVSAILSKLDCSRLALPLC